MAIMGCPKFALGVADVRAGRPQHPRYTQWCTNDQWNYERGRAWAVQAPRSVPLKRDGELNDEAVRWYVRVKRFII
jgi:hypothetical protein